MVQRVALSVSFRLGFAMRLLENSRCQPNSKWVPLRLNIDTLSLYAKMFLNQSSKDTSGTDQIRTQSLSKTSTGKMDKHILTNTNITEC